MERTIVIGDVHGCADELGDLLDLLQVNQHDHIIQVGDLINRGPDSLRSVRMAQAYSFQLVYGNHELRLLKARESGDISTLKAYDFETLAQLTEADWSFLQQARPYYHLPQQQVVVVHGGFLPNQPWQTQSIGITTQIQVIGSDGQATKRSQAPEAPAWACEWARGWTEADISRPFVIYGHTPRPEIFHQIGSIGIDTGCVYGGHLTAYILEENRCIQVPARRAYAVSKRFSSAESEASSSAIQTHKNRL